MKSYIRWSRQQHTSFIISTRWNVVGCAVQSTQEHECVYVCYDVGSIYMDRWKWIELSYIFPFAFIYATNLPNIYHLFNRHIIVSCTSAQSSPSSTLSIPASMFAWGIFFSHREHIFSRAICNILCCIIIQALKQAHHFCVFLLLCSLRSASFASLLYRSPVLSEARQTTIDTYLIVDCILLTDINRPDGICPWSSWYGLLHWKESRRVLCMCRIVIEGEWCGHQSFGLQSKMKWQSIIGTTQFCRDRPAMPVPVPGRYDKVTTIRAWCVRPDSHLGWGKRVQILHNLMS